MNEELINKYVTLNNIKKIAKKEGIILEDYETKIIYETIKKEWKTIIYSDPSFIFSNLKEKLKENTYKCILNLYNKYKKFI